MRLSRWKWRLEEAIVKIDGERCYIRRVVDHEQLGLLKICRLDLSRVCIRWDSNTQVGIIKSMG